MMTRLRPQVDPNEKELITNIDFAIESPKLNMFTPMDIFKKHVYPKYRTQILEGDDYFFLSEEYEVDGNMSHFVNIIKKMYRNSPPLEKEGVKADTKKLVTIIDKYYSAGYK